MHVMQIDWGSFRLNQSNLIVGQVVVVPGDHGSSVENWYLFATGTGAPPQGMGVYTWPSQVAQSVTTTYTCLGAAPQHFDPFAYRDQLQHDIGQGLTVQYVRADCMAPQTDDENEGKGGSKASKGRAKPSPQSKAKPKPKTQAKSTASKSSAKAPKTKTAKGKAKPAARRKSH